MLEHVRRLAFSNQKCFENQVVVLPSTRSCHIFLWQLENVQQLVLFVENTRLHFFLVVSVVCSARLAVYYSILYF